jgi:dTDP-4-amino-4,6-dideoxygalactose transaminase
MGLDQIARIDKIAEQRRQNAAHLIAGLKDLDLLVLPRDRVNARRAYRMFPIQVRGTKQMRNHISFFLERHGVETRPHFPLLDQPYYCQLFGDRSAEYPISTEVSNIGFYIGVHEYLEPADLDYVIEVMHAAVKGL